MYKGKVSFSATGDHESFVYYWMTDYTQRDNYVFKDDLVLQHLRRNRVVWRSLNTGRTYTSFFNDLIKFLPKLVELKISGLFTFRNNGGRTSLIPIPFEYEDYTESKKPIMPAESGQLTASYGGGVVWNPIDPIDQRSVAK